MASVSVWTDDLAAGALPPVCCKSGRAAGARLTFHFATWSWPGFLLAYPVFGKRAKGPLPLTRGWRTAFIVMRGIAIGLATATFVLYWLTATGVWALYAVFACLGAYIVAHTLYAGLRPKADVHVDRDGARWVHLRDVHPAFVQAVETAASSAGSSPPDEGESPSPHTAR